MMKKRLLALALCLVLCCYSFSAFAELSMGFWENNNRLIAALEQGDCDSAVWLCNEVVNTLAAEPETEAYLTMAATKLLQTSELLEKSGRYAEAASFFSRYIPYAERVGWTDGVKIAKAKVLQYTTRFQMYRQTSSPQMYYGAKHEPLSGVYYGVVSDSALADSLSGTSSVLLYIEYGDTNFDWPRVVLNKARERGQMVTIALNCPGQGTQISQILYDSSYASTLLEFLKQYPDLKLILRFGAEMNIWDTRANPQEFISAFRLIADMARSACSNIAMMWSPYSVSSWDIDMNDYYPGDEYVDWVGCSLYSQKYFTGRNDWSDAEKFNEVVFQTGDNADPILALSEIIEKYGDRKPIALSESGVSHYTRTLGEDCTDWAAEQLRLMYKILPAVYPQVKLMHYFDRSLSFEVVDVSLSQNETIKQSFCELVTLPHFIQRGQNKAASYYQLGSLLQAEDCEALVYAHKYKQSSPNCGVLLNGIDASRQTGENDTLYLKLSDFAPNNYSMQLSVGGEWFEQDTVLQKPLHIYYNQNLIEGDVPATILNDSTLVPIRLVSQALGTSVTWNGADRSITIKGNGSVLVLQIDSHSMYKNGTEAYLPAAPSILYDRTMVPLRAIGEALDIDVRWDAASHSVFLTD